MSVNLSCVILGAGGHARMLIDCLHFDPDIRIAGILAPSPFSKGQSIHGVSVLGDDNLMGDLRQRGISHFVVGLGGVGNNGPRKELFEDAVGHGLIPLAVRHPSAIISVRASYGEGCQFLPGCIVNTDAVLGSNVLVNSGAILEHDCMIGDHSHIATGARLAGNVHVGIGAHIGAGATIRQGIVVGKFAVIGAGSAVVKDVPPNATVMGVPARIYSEKADQ